MNPGTLYPKHYLEIEAYREYDADPTIPHGEAERVHLLLLRNGLTVLKEYEETEDEDR